MRSAISASRLALAAALLAAPAPAASAPARDLVAVRAGAIHLVEDGRVVEDGTLLVRGGRIVAVGEDVDVPVDARVVDYGPGAVIVPGLVAAHAPYASGRPADLAAEPTVRAVDGFDFYRTWAAALTGGVTSAYVVPAEERLVAGVAAVVKLAGDDFGQRTLSARAAVHGAIDASAREIPGFWEPPIPATSDRDMGFLEPQLPRTTAGAVVALGELLADARGGEPDSPHWHRVGRELRELVRAGVPWRLGAEREDEIRALVAFARENELPLVLDKALEADRVAEEIAAAGVPVVFRVPWRANRAAVDRGKGRDEPWPRFDVPAALVRAGVRVAIACEDPHDLLFSAQLASRGGLSEAHALRAITLTPAELFGVAERVGSLRPGKDADFAVLSGAPLGAGTSVLATWIGGELRWEPAAAHSDEPERLGHGTSTAPTVIEVDELHMGDGEVLRPGALLLADGEIVEVGPSVGRPRGARVVHGVAAMPGIVDALGHLGLEGSDKVPGADFRLRHVVGPGDRVDRRVALSGVTTVVLGPRGAKKDGAPLMAYKPAAAAFDDLVVGDPVALRLRWTEDNRLQSGNDVRELLAEAVEYREEWLEYERALAEWEPPAPAETEGEEADEDAAEGDEEEDEDENGDDEEEDDEDEEAEVEPDPVTGVWEASIERPPRTEAVRLRMRLRLDDEGSVEGNLRCGAVSETLVELEGWWDAEGRTVELRGLGSQGWVDVVAQREEPADDGKKKKKDEDAPPETLTGTVTVGGRSLELSAERTSHEYPVAGRPEPEPAEEAEEEPEGKPDAPKRDEELEPVRAALEGRGSVVVEVQRADEILDCVAAFEEHGLQPVLLGAEGVHHVVAEIAGRVKGVLLPPQVLVAEPKLGTDYRTPYSLLQAAGIPVAFHSGAEEGAIELPIRASYAVAQGMSATGALRALTADAADMFVISDRVGRLRAGLDADVLVLDGPPLAPRTSVVRVWVDGVEVELDEER